MVPGRSVVAPALAGTDLNALVLCPRLVEHEVALAGHEFRVIGDLVNGRESDTEGSGGFIVISLVATSDLSERVKVAAAFPSSDLPWTLP